MPEMPPDVTLDEVKERARLAGLAIPPNRLALVRGFRTSPREFSVGFARARNTFSWFNVRAAEDSIDKSAELK